MTRPDLSQRTGLSKSAVTAWEQCPRKSWFSKWQRRPFIPSERTVFGNAIDKGVEAIAIYHRMGREPNMRRVLRAGLLRAEGPIAIDAQEVDFALAAFETDVAPHFDWSHVQTQHHLNIIVEGWGEADGHPDLIFLADEDSIFDVKTSMKPRATAKTIEGGYYTLAREAETGRAVREFGYLNYVRKPGYWQGYGIDAIHERTLKTGPRAGQMVQEGHYPPVAFIDDDFRAWANEIVSGYVLSDNLDTLINERQIAAGLPLRNATFTGMPKNAGLCRSCENSPDLGGACKIAVLAPTGDDDE